MITDHSMDNFQSDDNGDTQNHHHHHYHFHYHFGPGHEGQQNLPLHSSSGISPVHMPDQEKKFLFFSCPSLPGLDSSRRAVPYPSIPYPPPYFPARNCHSRDPLPLGEDVRLFCQAGTGYSLTVRNGSVVLLAIADPTDEYQHWIKDVKYSKKVKDSEGFSCFALVNKFTGQALQHAVGNSHPVRLTPYRPNVFDESILWSMGEDLGDGYKEMRMGNNINLCLDAFGGCRVLDGTLVVLWDWSEGENQKWKLVSY